MPTAVRAESLGTKPAVEPPKDRQIDRRTLGNTGIVVSRLGLAGSFGVDADAVERAYHDFGINYFFVSPRMKGLVQGIQRLVAAGHRDDLVIAAGASIPTGGSVKRAWAKQAKLFGVDGIDVFHLFWVQANWYVTGKTWQAMEQLKQEGKVRALAVSCHDRPRARAYVDELGLDSLMIRYNAAHRGAEREIFASLDEKNRPGIVSYTATRWGRLLKPVGDLGPMSGPECYRFVLGHSKVDVALCGARSFDELKSNVAGVLAGPLSPERVEEIRKFGDAVRNTATGRFGFSGM